MQLETTATDITWTGYKCMNELSENIIAKIYFQHEKPVVIVVKN